MGKVPREWAEWTVKLTKNRQATIKSAAIYIGADVVTFASLAEGVCLPWLAKGNANQKIGGEAKKRLGSRRYTPSLTQSLTLSHANRILHTLKSSADLAIILPAALFTRVKLAAPTELAPSELAPTLRWAIQQQGFSPLEDWLWDAISQTETSAGQAHWEVTLLPVSVLDTYLERLGINQARLASLIPDDQIAPASLVLPMGPWLDNSQIYLALSYLQQRVEALNSGSRGTGRHLEPASFRWSPQLNLACNLTTQTTKRYYRGFFQCALMTSAMVVAGTVCWTQQATVSPSANDANVSQAMAPSIPLQPFFQHSQLWQALYALDGESVSIRHLEYLRGKWLLQIETLSPNAAGDWIVRLEKELNAPAPNPTASTRLVPWQVLTAASRSRHGSTIFDVEIAQ